MNNSSKPIREFQGVYRFLSNFWKVPGGIKDPDLNLRYWTVEHYYQAQKTMNEEERRAIALELTPGGAKRAGKKVTLREDWAEVRQEVMREGLRQKFCVPELRRKLEATGNRELQEGNRWGDTYWGIDLRTGQGHNLLGKMLMEERAKC